MTGNEQEDNRCEQQENSGSASTRVRRFRQNLREQDCGRLDVWIGGGLVNSVTSTPMPPAESATKDLSRAIRF
jgi:hypothetical protein